MEPRIATLLSISYQQKTHGPVPPVTLSSIAQTPRPVEPTSVGDDALVLASSFPSNQLAKLHNVAQTEGQIPMARQMPGAPIAHVLNTEVPMLHATQAGILAPTSPTIPFSSRHHDYILDGFEQVNKRRKGGQQYIQPALAGCENPVIKLPKLPQLPKRTARRPRIPPLLQGLHQPPPLPPEGRLFPPITSEKSTFASDPGERVGLDLYAEETRKREEYEILGSGFSAAFMGRDALYEEKKGEGHVALKSSPLDWPLQPDETDMLVDRGEISEASGRNKHRKKRSKWTEQETKDLLAGVTRFGIGSWKKILHDPDFEFNGRTAVDLKDRFRVCCPGEGLKSRKSKHNEALPGKISDSALTTVQPSKASDIIGRDTPCMDAGELEVVNTNQQRELIHCKALPELAELGILGPFTKSTRRPRRTFSAYDDENLLKGFEKYGPVWHAMRDDTELGFNTRHPTDLRDRFRIKYPEKYVQAGYKLKAKQERIVKENPSKWRGQEPWARLHPARNPIEGAHGAGHEPQLGLDDRKTVLGKSGLTPTTASCIPTTSSLKSIGLGQYLSDPLPTVLGDCPISEDGDDDASPVILNRNILRWADANPSSLSAFTQPQANTHGTANHGTGDMPLHVFIANDGIHINPLATLKLPSTTFYGNTMPAANVWPCNSSSGLLKQSAVPGAVINAPWDTKMISSANTAVVNPMNSLNATSSIGLSQTPSLPTISFPRVPAASARTVVHNLPAPADLLLGIDLEKPEPQALGITLDDALGLAM